MSTHLRPLSSTSRPTRFEATVVRGVLVCLVEVGLMFGVAATDTKLDFDNAFSASFYILTVLLIGSRMRALGNIVHECAHNSFTSSRQFNHICGQLLCVFDFRSFSKYKRQHMSHHRFLGEKNLDPDYLGNDFKLACYLKNFVPTLFYRFDAPWVNILRALWLAVLTGLVVFPITRQATIAYYFVPYFTSYFALRVYSDFSDHWGLTHHQNRDLRSRNHVFQSTLLNLILLPRNDGFHLLHHLFPNLPTWCYKAVHTELMTTDSEYRRLHAED